MPYLRTVVGFKEEEYDFLKENALKKRQSLASLVREAVQEKMSQTNQGRSPEEVERIMAQTRKHGKAMAKYLKGVDGVKIIREMRDNAKW